MAARILFAFFLIFTTSCGFRPIGYLKNNQDHTLNEQLSSIVIRKSSGTNSQLLRTQIFDIFNTNNIEVEPIHYLDLKVTESERSTFITALGSSGRLKLTIGVKYTLRKIDDNSLIASGDVSGYESYTVDNNRYGNFTSKELAREVVYKSIAENLRNIIIQDLAKIE